MRRLTAIFVTLLFCAGCFAAFIPSSAADVGSNCVETEIGTYCSQTILTDTEKFDGVAVGDADNDGIDDVIGGGLSGKVWMASKKGGEWHTKVLWTSPGEVIIPAVGDADNDGKNEVVVVGMIAGPETDTGAGHAVMIEGSGNYWTATRIFEDTHMIHAVAIGDVDPDRVGNEVVVGGFNYNMTLLWGSGDNWNSERMFRAEHKIRTVVIGDMDSDGQDEVVAATKDMNVYMVDKVGGAWVSTVLWTDTSKGPARCGVGDYDGDGNLDAVAGGDPKNFAYITKSGSDWSGDIIWEDSDKIRGAWIGDVYDGRVGNELISAGYSGNVTIHFQAGGAWKHVQVWSTPNRLHHAIIGDADPDHPGSEIITGGYDKAVTVIGQYHPDFQIAMTPAMAEITAETEANFKLTVTAKDFYTDEIDIEVEGLPTGASANFSADPVTLTTDQAATTITITVPTMVANGDHTFTVKATGDAGTRSVPGTLKVNRQVMPSVTKITDDQEVKKGDKHQSVMYTFKVTNNGNMADSFNIAVSSSNGFTASASMTKTATLQPGQSVNIAVTLTVPKDTKVKEDTLTLKATSVYDGATMDSDFVKTTIKESEDNGEKPCGGIIVFAILLACLGIVYYKKR